MFSKYVSVCLFFNSSRSLLISSCIFSILFSMFLIIFTIIILSFFQNAYFLFIYLDFCVSSLFLHLCNISLPFHFLFLSYCVWGLLFTGFKTEFFLPFGFCPPTVGPASYRVRSVLSFFCLFFLWWARLNELLILSADDWVCVFVVCCLYEAACKRATGGWMMPGLVFKWFPLCEFSLFDTP